jgi:hypothetical protein
VQQSTRNLCIQQHLDSAHASHPLLLLLLLLL